MNNQFATQFLLEDTSELKDRVQSALQDAGVTDEHLVRIMTEAVVQDIITLEKAIQIIQNPRIDEMTGSGGVGGGNTVGGGTTDGASWDQQGPTGTGEQYAAGTRRKKYQEDAPRLAGNPSKTNKQGSKNLNAYSSVGFTKAPSAQEAGKKIKGVQVKSLWKEGEAVTWEQVKPLAKALADKYLSRELHSEFFDYLEEKTKIGFIEAPQDVFDSISSFKEMLREDLQESRAYHKFKRETATRSKDQQMHEAVRMIHNKLAEVSKLLEHAQQMRTELSEGEQTLEYNHNTKKIFERINSKVVEIYSKTRQLK